MKAVKILLTLPAVALLMLLIFAVIAALISPALVCAALIRAHKVLETMLNCLVEDIKTYIAEN